MVAVSLSTLALCAAEPAKVHLGKGQVAVPAGEMMEICADVKAEGFARLRHVAADLDGSPAAWRGKRRTWHRRGGH